MQKVLLVTGASSGMGLEIVARLAKSGHIVYGGGRKPEDLAVIRDAGGVPVSLEMTDEASLRAAVELVMAEQGRIDVLCNNAGYGLYGSVEEVPIEAARDQFAVNLFGLAQLTQLVVPIMRAQQSGLIINTSSMGGKMYTPFGAWYHASKHALEGWSDCLRLELKSFGIRVVVLEPGIIRTRWQSGLADNLLKYSGSGPYAAHAKSLIARTTAAYRKGAATEPSEIARVVEGIVDARSPKTRYAAGKLARVAIFVRTTFGDRVFDRLIDPPIR